MRLNQTWKNCLRMWKWIDNVWEPWMCVEDLKQQWLKDHMDVDIDSDCFFCEYNMEHEESDLCGYCPGKLVSKSFHCFDRVTYRYDFKPKKFYQKLLQLDAKRRAKT